MLFRSAIEDRFAARTGVYVGTGLGGLSTLERYHKAYLTEGGARKISPFFIPMLISNLAPGHIAMRHGAKGPNISTTTACAASSRGWWPPSRWARSPCPSCMTRT